MLNEIYQQLDPIALSLGPLTVRWYGLAYVLGFVCAALVLYFTARRWKVRLDVDTLLTVMICAMLGVILGGRLGYVLFYGEGYYLQHPAEILALNHGGMSFHGGLMGALLGGIVAARIAHVPYLTLADLGCIAAPIGLFFGRWRQFRERRALGRAGPTCRGAWSSAALPVACRAIPRSSTRRCSRASSSSSCSSRSRAKCHRVRVARFWARSSSCTARSLPRRVRARARRAAGLFCGAGGSPWTAAFGAARVGGHWRARVCRSDEIAAKGA